MSRVQLPAAARALRAEATSGAVLAGGVLLVVVAAFTGLVANASAFSPGPNDPVNTATTATVFLAPLTCGLAAARAQQLRRSGVFDVARTTPVGVGGAVRLTGAACAGWGCLAYAVVTVLLLARASLTGPTTTGTVLLALLGVANIAAGTALGLLAGFASPWPVVAPLAALALFGWGYAFTYANGGLAHLSFVYPAIFYSPSLVPRTAVLARQLLVDAGLITLAVALLRLGDPGRRRWRATGPVAVGGLALAVLAATSLPGAGADSVAVRTQHGPVPCASDGAVQLCVWPEDRQSLPGSLQALVRVTAAVRDTYPVPHSFAEPGIGGRPDLGVGVVLASGVVGVPSVALGAAEQALLPAVACPSRASAQLAVAGLGNYVQALAGLPVAAYVPFTPDPRVAAVLAQDAAAQRAWVAARFEEAARPC